MLPLGFHRIRYDGFLGPRYRVEKLARCRSLLGTMAAITTPADATPTCARTETRMNLSLRVCTACHQGHMIVIERRPPRSLRLRDSRYVMIVLVPPRRTLLQLVYAEYQASSVSRAMTTLVFSHFPDVP